MILTWPSSYSLGSATVESAAAALELGLIEYLQKPLGVDLLVEAVGRALRERARNIFRRECGAANEE